MQEQTQKIQELLSKYDWFCGTDTDQLSRLIVYVDYMSAFVLSKIPDSVDNTQVLLHFDKSRKVSNDPIVLYQEEKSIAKQLLELSLTCPIEEVEHIFYEVHDGGNAVTASSVNYPDARLTIENLYDSYGFDVLHEEITYF